MAIKDWNQPIEKNSDNSNLTDFQQIIDKYAFEGQNKFDDITNALKNYWNQSVKTLYQAWLSYIDAKKKLVNNFKPNEEGEEEGQEGQEGENGEEGEQDNKIITKKDAGYSFSKDPYVDPNKNSEDRTYLQQRVDAIDSVLKNKDNLSSTDGGLLGNAIDDVNAAIVRLLMPQYKRRVEVEDLNRNFWVIGQNLTELNQLFVKIGNLFKDDSNILAKTISELMGIWDNIYKLWSVLYSLQDQVNNLDTKERIRVKLGYGYGNYSNETDVKNIDVSGTLNTGILPYIHKVQINDGEDTSRWVYYVPYNEVLQDIEKTNDELQVFLKNKKGNHLIQLDTEKTNRSISNILKQIKYRNFVLVATSKNDIFGDYEESPPEQDNGGFFQFFRDYLIYIDNANYFGMALQEILSETEEEKSDDLIQVLTFKKNNEFNAEATISSGVKNTASILQSQLHIAGHDDWANPFVNYLTNESVRTAKDLKTKFNNAENRFSMKSLLENFVVLLNFYRENNKTRHYTKTGGGPLPYVKWDLVSFQSDLSEATLNNGLGQQLFAKYLYPQETGGPSKHEEGLWIDFVNDVDKDVYTGDASTIGSITLIDKRRNGYRTEDFLYDTIITVPLKKEINPSVQNIPTYHDFVRLAKPYPSLTKLNEDTVAIRHYNEAEETFEPATFDDAAHLIEINDEENYVISADSNLASSYIDGFFGHGHVVDNNFVYEERLDNNISQETDFVVKDLLHYAIATSDMIDSQHDFEGQSKLTNSHNCDNPVVNLRFLNGRTEYQEVEIVTTKDRTKKAPKPEISQQNINYFAEMVRFGDFYPVNASNPNNIKGLNWPLSLITDWHVESGYDMSTYGIGSRAMKRGNDSSFPNDTWNKNAKKVCFYDYSSCNFETAIEGQDFSPWDKQTTEITSPTFYYQEDIKDEVNTGEISYSNIALKYIEKMINNQTITCLSADDNKPKLYRDLLKNKMIFTKIGQKCWKGGSGSQWEQGIVTDLFYLKETDKMEDLGSGLATNKIDIISLGKINRIDGYFNSNYFSTPGGRYPWRHLVLGLSGKNDPIKKVVINENNEENTFYLIPKRFRGYILWFDKNILNADWDSINKEIKTSGFKDDHYNAEQFYDYARKVFNNQSVEESNNENQEATFQSESNTNTVAQERLVAFAPFDMVASDDLSDISPSLEPYVPNGYTIIKEKEISKSVMVIDTGKVYGRTTQQPKFSPINIDIFPLNSGGSIGSWYSKDYDLLNTNNSREYSMMKRPIENNSSEP